MHRDTTGQEIPAHLIDNAEQATNKTTGADKKDFIGVKNNKAATKMGKTGRTSQAERLRGQWLREIAKKAASARWTRGD